ncbi:MAG: hypothetical protein GC192_11010 [Bacteroidetes bacterium]|nr:hypothetical protein [Bacteroidota bacterium]
MKSDRNSILKLITSDSTSNSTNRSLLSYIILCGALLIIGILSWGIINSVNPDGYKTVFNTIIPLLATWVGTVLAFYFGKENFEAASRQIVNALRPDMIDDIPIENVMIDTPTIVYKELSQDELKNCKLVDLSAFLASVRKDRCPIFGKDLSPQYIIHKSTIDNHLVKAKNDEEKNGYTLEAILKNEAEYKEMFSLNKKKGFIIVSKNEILEKAIEKMKAVEQCRDIFVTENGNADGKVLGWVTDSLIARFLNLKD